MSQVKLSTASIISNNMVLQQNSVISIWGEGNPESIVTVQTNWGETVKTTVDKNSEWLVKLNTPSASGPYKIKITDGISTFNIDNVLIGEVWLCSGQSNMEMPLEGWPPNDKIFFSEETIKNSNNNKIRFFTVSRNISAKEENDCVGEWEICSPSTSPKFSATAYFFGKKLYDELKVPIGLIHSSWGGTPAESWVSKDYLGTLPEFRETLNKINESIPAIEKLEEWLKQLPKIKISDKKGINPWANLEFNDEKCADVEFDFSNWKKTNLPNKWENTDIGEFDGVIWFRKVVQLPDHWISEKLRIELGPIDDFDRTYINGKLVGAIEEEGNWQTKRIYDIPSRINSFKDITIAVRVNDTRGGGGIYGKPDEMKLINLKTNEVIQLAGEWSYLPVAEFRGMVYYVFGSDNRLFNLRPKLPIEFTSNTPTLLYNAMIAPLVPYTFKGVIWYQGESNVGNPRLYERLFPTLINCWRDSFKNNFAFYFVQIAPYDYGDETKSELLRDAQRKTLILDKTGMAVTLDIGNINNIHPTNKIDVGERLALWALSKQYNKNIICSGPLYKSMKIKGNKIELEFDYVGKGLEIKNLDSQFTIAGVDKRFYKANAKIKNNKVLVWSDLVKNPFAVRYAMTNTSKAALFNKNGLPASSFRTDDWEE